MADVHKNFSYSSVATAPSPATSGTSLVVAAGEGALFPAVPFNATVWPAGAQPLASNAEIVRVTNIATDTLTIARAQEGSAARTVLVGDQIAATITAKTLTDAEAADGWQDDTAETWTYASATTFTVAGDLTAKFSKGTRLKLTQTTVKYFVVVASSHAAGTTTVTITGGSDYTFANAAVTLNYHSYMANPQGYPTFFVWAPAETGFTGTPTVSARFALVGRVLTMVIDTLTGTSNATTFTFTLPVAPFAFPANSIVTVRDNGAWSTGGVTNSGATATMQKVVGTAGGFTASGTKATVFSMSYLI